MLNQVPKFQAEQLSHTLVEVSDLLHAQVSFIPWGKSSLRIL